MGSVVKSIRIDKKTLSEVESLLHTKKETFSSLTSDYLFDFI